MQTQVDPRHERRGRNEEPPRLIINADDFGRSPDVVAAVSRAHDEGVLTSASLMVTGDAAQVAAAAARERPRLGVGLHLVMVRGRPASVPSAIPHLVDSEGRLPQRVTWAALRYAFSSAARRELARELRAQFERFRDTGLPLTHVDSHHHLHLHPTIFPLVLSLAHEFGAKAIRINVADHLRLSLGVDRRHPLLKLLWKGVFLLLAAYCRRLVRRQPLPAADQVYGLLQSGRLTADYVLACLRRLSQQRRPPRVVEIFGHPSLRTESSDLGPNPSDLATLLDPRVRSSIAELGFRLANYGDAFGR